MFDISCAKISNKLNYNLSINVTVGLYTGVVMYPLKCVTLATLL